jgi:hypothetical protein
VSTTALVLGVEVARRSLGELDGLAGILCSAGFALFYRYYFGQ